MLKTAQGRTYARSATDWAFCYPVRYPGWILIRAVFGSSSGAARGIRTPDPLITNEVLYQLSYCGEPARHVPA